MGHLHMFQFKKLPKYDEAKKHNPKHMQQPGEQLYARLLFDWLSLWRPGGQHLPHQIQWNCKAMMIWFRNWIDNFGSAFSLLKFIPY